MKNILFKAAILGLLLLFAQDQQFSVLSVILFLFFAALLYVQPIFHTSSLLFSFLSFTALALVVPLRFPVAGAVSAAVFAWLFYLIVGVKNLVLIRRREWYYLLFLCLNYLALFLFFSIGPGVGFWLKSLAFFVFVSGMLREFLRFHGIELLRIHKVGVFAASLVILECVYAVSLLPVGFSNAASLMTAMVFIFGEICQRYMRGTLSARFIRLSILFLALVMVVIYFVSTWKL